jgi:hypothetical protein
MDKPDWCPEDVWCDALQVASPLPIGELGQKTLAREVAKAILSAQSQAYIDAARIAEEYYTQDTVIKKQNGEPYNSGNIAISCAQRISAAILQRKEEIGRN